MIFQPFCLKYSGIFDDLNFFFFFGIATSQHSLKLYFLQNENRFLIDAVFHPFAAFFHHFVD